MTRSEPLQIAAVIPCYRVKAQILDVLAGIGPEVARIYVVDDACPDGSGAHVSAQTKDPRVQVIRHEQNRGVGGAVMTGYRAALRDGLDVVVKIDGDGQMDPAMLPALVAPILEGRADYTKGNRFFSLEGLTAMPKTRIFGNSMVSFLSKVASGYWNVMDPANGYTAIHARVLAMLPLEKIDERYFFESDMLFRLYTIRAVVEEIAMEGRYAGERSNLRPGQIALEFPPKYALRFGKRIFYGYFLRDFNACSIEIVSGGALMSWGAIFGGYQWYLGALRGEFVSAGTVMLAAMPLLVGFQLFLAAINFDVANIPARPLSKALSRSSKQRDERA